MNRKIFLPILFLFTSCFGPEAWATVRTVSNASNSIAQHTTIAAAIAAASAGDTIYVMPTGILYPSTTITKPLVLMGSGAWPEGLGGLSTNVLQFIVANTASGCTIKGFNITTATTSIAFQAGPPINNVIIEMNRLAYAIAVEGPGSVSNNIVVRNNLFAGAFFAGNSVGIFQNGWIISNNIFNGPLGSFGVSSSVQNMFLNNIIYRSGTTNNPLSGLNNTLIANNIIVGGGDAGLGNIVACQVNNNCFYGNYTLAGIIGAGSTGSNNLIGPGQNPLFAEATNFNATMFAYAPVAPFVDLHLQPGSPCIGSGQLGADMGIYDGGFPWMDNTVNNGQRTYYPGARIPEMLELYSTGTAPTNSTLDVQIKGKNVN